jgi:menaquinone reductase, multiheme cytochrome c subunit
MSWCLQCHRNPDANLRPPAQVTNMNWAPEGESREEFGKKLRAENHINPPTDCSTCHR